MGNLESGMNNIMDSDAISSYSSEDDIETGYDMFHMLMDNNENGESRSNEDYFFNLLLQRFIHTGEYNFGHSTVNPRRLRMPQIKGKPNLENLKKNSIYQSIKYASGFGSDHTSPAANWSIVNMINKRQNGIGYRNGAFTQPERCKLSNNFLPNVKKALLKFDAKVFCGTFSPNGNYFVTASQDSVIRVHDATTTEYKKINQLTAKDVNWCILDVAFSPDSEYIVYSTWSSCLYINRINGNTQQLQPLFLQPLKQSFCIFSLAFSNCGEEIIGGGSDGCLYIYDRVVDRRTLRIPIDNESHDINSVGFMDETSNIIYTGSDNGIIKMWDRRSMDESNPKEIGLFVGHLDGITYIDSKKDARYLISNSKDQSIKLWDMRLFSSSDAQTTVSQSPRRRTRYHNRWDYRWDEVPKEFYTDAVSMADDASIMTYRGHRVCKTLIRAKFSPQETTGQRYIYTGCGSGRLIIYDILTGNIVHSTRGHKDIVRDVAWHSKRNEILTSSWDNNVNVNFYRCQNRALPKRLIKDETGDGSDKTTDPPPRRSRRIALRQNNQHAVL